jgi:hypothetical protein
MRSIAVGLVLLVAGAAAFGARAAVQRTGGGVVRAVVSGKHEGRLYLGEARLRIVRRGIVRLDVPVKRLTQQDLVDLFVRDLDGDGEPEVVLDVWTRGAHCCSESLIYHYDPARRTYGLTFRDWGNAGYRLVTLDEDRTPELRSADDRFAYAFTSYAASADPIRIWRFDRGQLLDVTGRFPKAVEADAAMWWREYVRLRTRADRPDVRGILAAWLADQHLLGRRDEGWQTLEAAYVRGELGPRSELAGWPQGRAYLQALRTYLRKLGYA